MIAILLLLALPAPASVALLAPLQQSAPAEDPAFEAKLTAAGKDVAKMLELANACTAANQAASARKAFAKVLELDPANEAAHKGLNHQLYEGKWFESFAELSKFKRDEDAAMKAKGLARFKDQFVPIADVACLKMGWVKDKDGHWQSQLAAASAKLAEEKQAAGCEFRVDDSSWVAPDEQEHWAKTLWKCGDEWVEMKVANAYHAEMSKWWQLTGEHFVVDSTCDWDNANRARWYADKAYPDLVRLFGLEPASKPEFVVLNSLAQYNQASGGTPPLIPESEGASSVYGAYFADANLDPSVTPPQYAGTGVSFWGSDRDVTAWGPYWLRWAAAQSFVESIDPSWNAVGDFVSSAGTPNPTAGIPGFWAEKKIPRWMRWGAAGYAERFLKNPEAADGADPWDIRKFAFTNLKQVGGLEPLDDVFRFVIDLKDGDKTSRLYHEAGLLVAFVLDGAPKDKELADKHAAFKKALASGSKDDVTAAVDGLQKALIKRDKDIRAWAGLDAAAPAAH
jgi:tetratricopeptide (TPR) repeat protein